MVHQSGKDVANRAPLQKKLYVHNTLHELETEYLKYLQDH